jgi:hypothetical protein
MAKNVVGNPWVFDAANQNEGVANAAESTPPVFNVAPIYVKHFVVYGGATGGTVKIDNDTVPTRSIVPATEIAADAETVIPIESYVDGVYITTLDSGLTVYCHHGQ